MYEEDYPGFLWADELADTITVVATGETFRGVFDHPLEVTEFRRQGVQQRALDIAVRYPKLLLPTHEAKLFEEHMVIEVRGELYDVVEFKPDGTGWTEIKLTEHQPEPAEDTGSDWR